MALGGGGGGPSYASMDNICREKTSGFHDNSQYSDAELSLGPRQAHHLFAPHILNKHSMQPLWSSAPALEERCCRSKSACAIFNWGNAWVNASCCSISYLLHAYYCKISSLFCFVFKGVPSLSSI